MTNNAFYFILIALFVLKIFLPFCPTFSFMQENCCITILRYFLKFVMSQTGTQAITINILPDISKSKDNKTLKSAQLIEYNVRNIFLQKSCRK